MEGLKPVGGFTLENWRFLWDPASVEQLSNKPPVIPLTINTFVFSLATTGVVLLISSMAGYALSRLRFARIGKLPGVRGAYGYLDAHALASRRCGSTANYLRDRLGTVLRLVPGPRDLYIRLRTAERMLADGLDDLADIVHSLDATLDLWTLDADTPNWEDRLRRAVEIGADVVTTNTPRRFAAVSL
jgi:hypothetical protein